MDREKCETFFPKLEVKIDKGKPSKHKKKKSTTKLQNKSLQNDGKFRLTYHDILQSPKPSLFLKQRPKQQKYFQMRATSMNKNKQIKPLAIQPQSTLKGYQILGQLGKGGFAEVVQVKDDQGRRYAMKQYILQNSLVCYKNQCIVGQHFFENGKLKNKFAQSKGGNNIIKYIEKIKSGKKGYIIQELGGKSLSKALSDIHGVFYKGQRVYQIKFTKLYEQLSNKVYLSKILLQIAYSIKLLNSQGFIHCDLKPQNILIDISSQNNPICKLIDFGSAFLYKQGLPKITITPQYMPPQLLLAIQSDNNKLQQNVDLSKIDIWSLGCLLLQILTGIPLWFRYKCKIQINNRQILQLSYFALTGREYYKIMKKQKQICNNIKKIGFVFNQFQVFRKLLMRILVYDVNQRANIQEIITFLENIK